MYEIYLYFIKIKFKYYIYILYKFIYILLKFVYNIYVINIIMFKIY